MTFHISIDPRHTSLIAREAARWREQDTVARIWGRDPTVWADPPGSEIADRLGWLDAPEHARSLVPSIRALYRRAVTGGITDIVLCGMGGPSLAPEVFASTLPTTQGSPKLTVMDSTHPEAVRQVASSLDYASTWFVVSSKSGETIETMSFLRYFWERAASAVQDPGRHFIAVTDPGSNLEAIAAEKGFRTTVTADPDVGGRYSALTAFGLVPAGLIGADITSLLDAAARGAALCGADVRLEDNPGFAIGVLLALRARAGANKAHFLGSGPAGTLGIWIEQLVAESTGKQGVGIIPIDGGPLLHGSPDATVVSIGEQPGSETDVSCTFGDPYDIATAMFVLEFATAVAGAVLGVNPFNQPDVEVAKRLASEAMSGSLAHPDIAPTDVSSPLWVETLTAALTGTRPTYVSIQAYLAQSSDTDALLETLRGVISQSLDVYVTTGYGPRFLHSTGQLHKGGPAGGVFLQIVNETGSELKVPGARYTFNELIEAQARGDRAALAERGRTVVALNIGSGTRRGLASVLQQVEESFT